MSLFVSLFLIYIPIFSRTTTNNIADDIVGPISSSNTNGKLNSLSNSNSLTNVMTVGDMKQSIGTQNAEEFHLNSCKSLNGISSLVSEALNKSGVNSEQGVRTLGINGTDISQSWKNFIISPTTNLNNNTSNSSGENSTTSLNEMGRVGYSMTIGELC